MEVVNEHQFRLKKSRKNKSTSIYEGVYYDNNMKKWYSRISTTEGQRQIGYFKTELEAAIAYNKEYEDLASMSKLAKPKKSLRGCTDENGFEYDSYGRMKFHPDFHDRQNSPMTVSDLEYLCKFSDVDDLKTLSYALGRTEGVLAMTLTNAKKSGAYEYFKNNNFHWG